MTIKNPFRKPRVAWRESKKLRTVILIAGSAVLLLACILIPVMLLMQNRWTITFSIPDCETVYVEYGDSYEAPEVTAEISGTIFGKKPTPLEVTVTGDVDDTVLGCYPVYYSAARRKTAAEAKRIVIVRDTTAPEITLTEDPEHYTLPNSAYEEEGYQATDLCDGDLTKEVAREERDGSVYYEVTDSSGNTAEVVRKIRYDDPIAPELTVECEKTVTVAAGSAFSNPACTAVDNVDGDISSSVSVTGEVNVSTPGSYALTYSVSDAYGNKTETTVTVTVVDVTAPVVSLAGEGTVYLEAGASYSEAGYSAADDLDGDLTAGVTVSGGVDTGTPGTYTLTYSASDRAGNVGTATRTVVVYAKQNTVNPGDKVIYLTFDDGPGPYTQKLLDVLAKYNVKATFFVTGQFPNYLSLIASEAAAGHTVAVHTWSHRYEEVYSSVDAFNADFEKMRSTIESLTGTSPTLMRFPGGSSNETSIKYCPGIMTTLTGLYSSKGYTYVDWNVSSQDAAGAGTAAEVYQNVIQGVQGKSVSVVLQHDLQSFSVDAVEDIIRWGLANGYTFLPLTSSSPTVHHTVVN